MNEKRGKNELEPPDGGWGWMIVFGTALSQMMIIPILQNFTLIFKDRFAELGFSSTDITTLVSLNASFGMILGLFNGPLLKILGYRKVALAGVTIYVSGILCTGVAKSYIEFIVFYGLLSSLGMAMAMASFSLAVNSYFSKNRSKAVGYTMTLTGLGPIALPFLISYLLSSFGLKWTVFLLSGLSLHSYVGALLLQPVKWHMKSVNEKTGEEENNVILSSSFLEISVWGSKMSLPNHSANPLPKSANIQSKETLISQNKFANQLKVYKENQSRSRKMSLTFLDNEDYQNMMDSTLHMIEKVELSEKYAKFASEESLNIELEENCDQKLKLALSSHSLQNGITKSKLEKEGSLENDQNGLFIKFIRFLKDIYDLDLLHDPFYITIMLGLSMAFVGEVIFSTMTPIILKEIGFSTQETATFMSVIAGCDLLCRFIGPFIGEKLNFNSKRMYLIALFMLLLSRAGMYIASTYETCLLISFGLGIGKGFRSVFWVLVLPDYVPLRKLASASAFQSLVNGILILLSGPLIGTIIALTGSYLSIVAASNFLTLATVILWTGEIIYLKYKKKG